MGQRLGMAKFTPSVLSRSSLPKWKSDHACPCGAQNLQRLPTTYWLLALFLRRTKRPFTNGCPLIYTALFPFLPLPYHQPHPLYSHDPLLLGSAFLLEVSSPSIIQWWQVCCQDAWAVFHTTYDCLSVSLFRLWAPMRHIIFLHGWRLSSPSNLC